MNRTLRNNEVRFWTGCLSDGRQAIFGPSLPNILIYYFDAEGKYLEKEVVDLATKPTWNESAHVYVTDPSFIAAMEAQIISIQDRIDFTPQTIQIEDFFDEEEDVGVQPLPEDFEEYLDDPSGFEPDDRSAMETAIKEWHDKGRFVFVWGAELWISCDGEVISS